MNQPRDTGADGPWAAQGDPGGNNDLDHLMCISVLCTGRGLARSTKRCARTGAERKKRCGPSLTGCARTGAERL
eukprot:6337902-Prymnesium_polylepis.1